MKSRFDGEPVCDLSCRMSNGFAILARWTAWDTTLEWFCPCFLIIVPSLRFCPRTGIVSLLEYMSGLFSGYMLGSLTDLPRLMFRPVEQLGANQGWKQASGRLLRMHQKSLKWGTRYVGCLLVRVVVGWFGSSFRRGIVRLVQRQFPELLLCASIPCCCLFIVDCVCVRAVGAKSRQRAVV